MKKFQFYLIILSIGFSIYSCSNSMQGESVSPGNTTYYINPQNGDDSSSGLKESQAWKTFMKINNMRMSPGDKIEIVSPGSFNRTLILKGSGTPEKPVKVHFAPGRYDFFPENILRKKFNISNTNASPDSLKGIGIYLNGASNFEISGEGAEIVYRGKMIEVCIEHCENVLLTDLHFDYYRPTVSEFKVVAVGDNYADIEIHKDSKYKIVSDSILWYGEGWESHTPILGQELNLEENRVRRLWNPIEGMQMEEIEPGLVRVKGEHKLKKNHVYQLREIFRDYAAVFIRRSKDITWKNVHFHFLHGMGLVCQFSENLVFDSVAIAPDSESGRTTAAWADCLHLSGCKGKILIKDCVFKGAHDDAINIHGTYMQVVEIKSDKVLKLRFMHKQTYGFMAFNPGDEIDFINHESYESLGMFRIVDAELLNPREILVTLEDPIPQELRLNDAVENVTWTPEVEIRGCKVSWIPTRGFLVSTRKKVVIEDNEFLTTNMSAILMAIDANKWYESGFVRDMDIRNNKFIRCSEPVILIDPHNSATNDDVYKDITIENNEFILRNNQILKAKSTKNLRVAGNTIYAEKELSDELSVKTIDCANVEMSQNRYLKLSEQ